MATNPHRKNTAAVRRVAPKLDRVPGNTTQFDEIGRNVAIFTAAYLLDIAGMMDESARRCIDRLDSRIEQEWPRTVEALYNFDRAFVQNVYAVLLDSFLPHDAMAFVLRGLDIPHPVALLESVLSLTDAPVGNE